MLGTSSPSAACPLRAALYCTDAAGPHLARIDPRVNAPRLVILRLIHSLFTLPSYEDDHARGDRTTRCFQPGRARESTTFLVGPALAQSDQLSTGTDRLDVVGDNHGFGAERARSGISGRSAPSTDTFVSIRCGASSSFTPYTSIGVPSGPRTSFLHAAKLVLVDAEKGDQLIGVASPGRGRVDLMFEPLADTTWHHSRTGADANRSIALQHQTRVTGQNRRTSPTRLRVYSRAARRPLGRGWCSLDDCHACHIGSLGRTSRSDRARYENV